MMKPVLLILFGLLFAVAAGGQDQKVIDSLHLVLARTPFDHQYPYLHSIGVEYVNLDNNKALEWMSQAERSALLSGDSSWVVTILRTKAQILSRMGHVEDFFSVSDHAYRMAQRHAMWKECMMIANTVGCTYLLQSQFDKALENLYTAHEMATSIDDKAGMGMTFENIGLTYYKLRDYEKAIRYLEDGLAIKRSLGAVGFASPMNISLCYLELGQVDKARSFLEESMNNCGADCGEVAMIHVKYTSGSIHFASKHYDSAEVEFQSSYSFAKKTSDYRMQLDNIYLLTKIHITKRRIVEAAALLSEAERIVAHDIPFNMEKIKIYSRLSELFYMLGNFERAAVYQRSYITLKDSIYNENLTTGLMKIESFFQERKNREIITAQEELITLKEKTIADQKLLAIVSGSLALTLLTLLGFLLKDHQRRKNLNTLLEIKVRDRTRELELGRDESLQLVKQKELEMKRIRRVIAETVNTVNGLCATAQREAFRGVASVYLKEIQSTMRTFSADSIVGQEGAGVGNKNNRLL